MVQLGSPVAVAGPNYKSMALQLAASKRVQSFPFIPTGASLRDYVKRKLLKATKDEVRFLLKSTSNLNVDPDSSANKTYSTLEERNKTKKNAKSRSLEKPSRLGNTQDDGSKGQRCQSTGEHLKNEEINQGFEPDESLEVSLETSGRAETNSKSIKRRGFPAMRTSKRKAEKTEQGLKRCCPVSPMAESHKTVKWTKEADSCEIETSYPRVESNPVFIGRTTKDDKSVHEPGQGGSCSKVGEKPKTKWAKRVKRFAIRTCRYLGYGAQMMSPLTPYADIPMPVTLDTNEYSPYGTYCYGYYGESVYGCKTGHQNYCY